MPLLHIFSYATDASLCKRLRRSADQCKVQIRFAGDGQLWSGMGDKLRGFREALRHWSADDVALFVDGYDTVFLKGERDLLAAYEEASAEVLFSAEAGLWPESDAELAALYPPSTTPFRFVNAGVYMGRVGALRALFEAGEEAASCRIDALDREHPIESDQRFLTRLYLRDAPGVALDQDQALCSNLFGTDADHYQIGPESQIKNLYTGRFSCILHGNGAHGASVLKTLLESVEEQEQQSRNAESGGHL